jgi:hypothetical protein
MQWWHVVLNVEHHSIDDVEDRNIYGSDAEND